MTSRARKLVVAAVLVASVPAAALAHDRECEHGDWDDDRPVYAPPPVHAPPPAYAPAPEYPAAYRWREDAWRGRRIAQIRAELQRLEARRAEAVARFGWNPRRMWSFERWYAARRAELEQRLQRVAWR